MDTWQNIGWNKVTLSCPAEWETIISGDTHLLFEKNFQPLFELRWQAKKKKKQSVDATLCKIAEETGLLVQDSLPPSWKQLQKNYAIKLLADNDTRELQAAILICKECGATLLLYFFHNLATKHHWDLTRVISSISCHEEEEQNSTLWAVQDFQILLPKTFVLSGHNFGTGLTRLSFTNSRGLVLHLCRLAGASQRLQSSSMASLMNLLGDLNVPEEEIQHLKNSVSHCSYPSIFQQIRSRFKRKLPFHWTILRHHPEHDRLSGLFFFDKKPISEEMISTILDSYEIFPI